MFRVVFSFLCSNAKCKKVIAMDPSNQDPEALFVEVSFDMNQGIVSYVCPECHVMSVMQMVGTKDVKPHRKLGGLRVF